MNVQHAPTGVAESRERHSYARLQERWIVLARVGWAALVILTLGIFFASLPVYLALLQTPCAGTVCAFSQQLSHGQVGMLKGIGISPDDYAAYNVVLTLATMVVCLLVSTLLIWRRPYDWMALLVALMLVTLGPIIAMSFVSASSSPWWVPNACLYFLALALVLLVFSLFPSGQFVPRWTRWTLIVCLAWQVLRPSSPMRPSRSISGLIRLVISCFSARQRSLRSFNCTAIGVCPIP